MSDEHKPTHVQTAVERRRDLPQRLRTAITTAEGDMLRLLQDALDEIEKHRVRTAEEVGFTFEPTGERVQLFAPDVRCLEIITAYPATLEMLRLGLARRRGESPTELLDSAKHPDGSLIEHDEKKHPAQHQHTSSLVDTANDAAEDAYLAARFRDARREVITREDAAKLVERWAPEGQRLPAALSSDDVEGWEAACEVLAKALRWEGFHL